MDVLAGLCHRPAHEDKGTQGHSMFWGAMRDSHGITGLELCGTHP